MKLSTSAPAKTGERGSATLILFVLLSIMLILVAVNGRALLRLHHQIKFVEEKQVQRLNQPSAGTNSIPAKSHE